MKNQEEIEKRLEELRAEEKKQDILCRKALDKHNPLLADAIFKQLRAVSGSVITLEWVLGIEKSEKVPGGTEKSVAGQPAGKNSN